MLTQTDYAGYMHEAPDFAEGPESYVGEYPYPGQYPPYPASGGYPYQAQPMPFMPSAFSPISSMGGQPPWWRWPIIHSSWINQFRPWRQPPFLSMWRLRQPFEQSGPARQMALMRWQQQQGMAPGQMPGMMPGMPYPGMPQTMTPGLPALPGAPGMPGYPGQPFPGAAAGGGGGRRSRRRRRR